MALGRTPTMPAPEKPKPVPVADDTSQLYAARQRESRRSQSQGYQSTILNGRDTGQAPVRATLGYGA